MDENTSGLSGEIQKMILDKLNTFNRGKTSDKGRYYILLPTSKTLYYTLWFFTPSATYHPTVYLANLDLNAISSVNKAIKMVSNSFLPLFITTDIKDSPDNGDDIISFGKYRGYHLHDIYTIDPRYVVWIADKYEPHVKSEMRFKELAVTYSKIYLDLQTRKKYKKPVSRFVGTPGEKLSDLKLTITKVRIEDDSYKTQIIRGTEYFYVDQLLTAVDIAGLTPGFYIHRQTYSASFFFIEVVIFCSSLSKSTIIVSPSPTEARIIISAISSSRYFWIARFNGRAPNWIS